MSSPWVAVLTALFIWWFSTGAILWRVKHADRQGQYAHSMSVVLGLPLLGFGIWGLLVTRTDASLAGTYLAFFSALSVWGFIELAFLSGVITGPNATPCPEDTPEWERFIRAWGTIAYHEMTLVALLIVIVMMGWGSENVVGVWTYIVLFFARLSAKLNLFFGVPKINTEFLPLTLTHLESHFRRGPVNWFFPAAISVLSFAVACWLERLYSAPTEAATAGYALLTTITALALLEHWFMVLPLPDEKLWRWMIPAASKNEATD